MNNKKGGARLPGAEALVTHAAPLSAPFLGGHNGGEKRNLTPLLCRRKPKALGQKQNSLLTSADSLPYFY